ncbi:hypothetical protein DVH24_039093, partial [Malus domestica]
IEHNFKIVPSQFKRCQTCQNEGTNRLSLAQNTILCSMIKGHVAFGTWDGTKQSGTRCSVPRFVHLKRVECVVQRDKFWMIFRSASLPWNDLFHIRGTQIYNILRQKKLLHLQLCISVPVLRFAQYCIGNQRSAFVYLLPLALLSSTAFRGMDEYEIQFFVLLNVWIIMAQVFTMNAQLSRYRQQQKRQWEIASLEKRTFVRLHVRREEINCITNTFAVLCDLLQTRGGLVDDGHVTIE